MIFGVGTDIVEISRVAKAIRRSDRFLQHYYTEKEQELLSARGKRRDHSAAMNFAGKEAVSKALRTGITKDVRLAQIEILREDSGAPYVVLYGETCRYAREHGITRLHISLSDTDSMAAAYVVAEGRTG